MKLLLSRFFIFTLFFLPCTTYVINEKNAVKEIPQILATADAKACAMNANKAWVDVALLIDNSANMGASNLRKISTIASLIFSKFTIGNSPKISHDHRNTRVAVLSYNLQATVEANFSSITSLQDLANVLNGIQVSTNKEANIYSVWLQSRTLDPFCGSNIQDVTNCIQAFRPRVMIYFAAANK
uniref:VWFA domain-containing protein n=1 Tax=Acrobeloides nanus TaxID=290746 RepID=A0A914DEQ7_9BILA